MLYSCEHLTLLQNVYYLTVVHKVLGAAGHTFSKVVGTDTFVLVENVLLLHGPLAREIIHYLPVLTSLKYLKHT